MKSKLLVLVLTLALVLSAVAPTLAAPPAPVDDPVMGNDVSSSTTHVSGGKNIDVPNRVDYLRLRERQRLLEAGQVAEANALAQAGTDRVLAIVVNFTGTDVFTWTAGTSTWDPYGYGDASETGEADGDCSHIITQTTVFTYTSGPSLNQIPRPQSIAANPTGSIWTENFTRTWYNDMLFGNGVVISYTMENGDVMNENFIGKSVANYFSDFSSGTYTITGDVVFVNVPHTTWYYGADTCPGAISGGKSALADGAIPGAGTPRTLVRDALNALNAISDTVTVSDGEFDWAKYDLNQDGVVDRLWIIHAGIGEEEGSASDDVPYGEAAVWSHSSQVTPPYSVTDEIAVGPYIIMPENGGVGVFAHEYGHNLGFWDLYAYGNGETSAGFWALQADDWTGYPLGFLPPSPDPLALDLWGWLQPMVITDTSKVYEFTLGQASEFPGGEDMYRGARIELPTGSAALPISVWGGSYYWWGGKADESNAAMTTAAPIAIPAGATTATLSFETVYGMEEEWDYMWVQVSTDNGTTWHTLRNSTTISEHVAGWIGDLYNMDGEYGFTGYNASFPDPDTETFDLTAYKGQSILVRFWYMTDWGTTVEGPFVDNVVVKSGATTLFSDDAETAGKWTFTAPWVRGDGTLPYSHNYYLQWRNVAANGGYDSSLGNPKFRYGPVNTGLLVWYNNNYYSDNEIENYLNDGEGFGPKGSMLVIDANPEPYRNPTTLATYPNEAANLPSRGMMRDATFRLKSSVNFQFPAVAVPGVVTPTQYTGRPAVSSFNDALGYYPGAEYGVRDNYGGNPRYAWMTKQWDASVVVPAKKAYGIKADGYTGDQDLRYRCTVGAGFVGCAGLDNKLGYDGGTGNPGDVNAQYGWHVDILEEGADGTWAKVRVYNLNYVVEPTYEPESVAQKGVYTVTYQSVVQNPTAAVNKPSLTYQLDPALNLVRHEETYYRPSQTVVGMPFGVVTVTGKTVEWSAADLRKGDLVTLTLWATGTAQTRGEVVSTLLAKDATSEAEFEFVTLLDLPTTVKIYMPVVLRAAN